VTLTDPVRLVSRSFQRGSAGGASLESGSLVSELDIRGRPLRQTRVDTAGNAQGSRQYAYDGLGRLRRAEDELGNVTLYEYDALDRLARVTLPDGSVMTRDYVPYLDDDSVSRISLTSPDGQGQAVTQVLGEQEFDSLGRLTRSTSGGRTHEYTYEGAGPAPAALTTPAGETLRQTYVPELDNAVSHVSGPDLEQGFGYDVLGGLLVAASEDGAAGVELNHFPSGQLRAETFTPAAGGQRQSAYSWSLLGSLESHMDVTGAQTQWRHDGYGRLVGIGDAALAVTLEHDALGRVSRLETVAAQGHRLEIGFTHDDFGRESGRSVTQDGREVVSVSQQWRSNGQLASRQTSVEAGVARDERFEYDVRNRLTDYSCSGSALPEDAYGQRITAQRFDYDALDNLRRCVTTLADGSTDEAVFHYGNAQDPVQLGAISHTHGAYPPVLELAYDGNGRLVRDGQGRELGYDVQGRLVSVTGGPVASRYGYDALDRLVAQAVGEADPRELYYRGGELVNELFTGRDEATRLVRHGHTCVGVSTADGVTLVAGDPADSPLWSTAGADGGTLHGYAPWGSGEAGTPLPGFTGERADPATGVYHLGNGYRAYSPVLMRFTCPDSLSPFGAGGINAYAYCAGDPVNLTDPSGHLSTAAWVGIGLGIAGILASVFTAGLAIAAAGGVMAALASTSTVTLAVGTAGLASDVTAIVSGALEESSPEASAVLGWVSLGTGIAGIAQAGATGARAARRAAARGLRPSRGASGAAAHSTTELPATLHSGEIFRPASAPARPYEPAVNFSPHNARPVQWSKATEVSAKSRFLFRYMTSEGYVSDFGGTGQPGIIIHGSSSGWFNPESLVNVRPERLPDYFLNHHGIDLSADNGPLHLVACYSGAARQPGQQSMAQLLANKLGRTVISYGGHERVWTKAPINKFLGKPQQMRSGFLLARSLKGEDVASLAKTAT